MVESEETPSHYLLNTVITKTGAYQKQQGAPLDEAARRPWANDTADTLIVWTEENGIDMALSFQEADGCASIWSVIAFLNRWRRTAYMNPRLATKILPSREFTNYKHTQLQAQANGMTHPVLLSRIAPTSFASQQSAHSRFAAPGPGDDALSDGDAMETYSSQVSLPVPDLSTLPEIDQIMRMASSTANGREALAKFLVMENYPRKIIPLVEAAEEAHALGELHRLSNIMKMMILLNDSTIIEQVVSDELILGVVGALECWSPSSSFFMSPRMITPPSHTHTLLTYAKNTDDQEFPHHKANHRQYLRDRSRFKEVVPIDDQLIKRKIHNTWRLQYLKDVVLARILDDPTFSVLNSLIFFNQVDIVTHLHANDAFLKELFAIISSPDADTKRKKDAISFIQQCCAIAKNLQVPPRALLYANFVENGLLGVITFALEHTDSAIRTTGTDILVAMIDHDPVKVRQYIVDAANSAHQKPLLDTLIDLLLVENDLGVKSQAADAIKVLLDPQISATQQQEMARQQQQQQQQQQQGQGQEMFKIRQAPAISAQTENFIQNFYDEAAKRLFAPLKDLEERESGECCFICSGKRRRGKRLAGLIGPGDKVY